MSAAITRAARAVRIHVPVAPETLQAVLAGNSAAMEADPTLGAMLRIIREQPALGDFGLYDGVAEIGLGWETFTPAADAAPTLGAPGKTAFSPTVTLTTWIASSATEKSVDDALAALMAAHPWEVPVIEVTESRLVVRPPAP
ncbi:hypothetical protein OLX02_07260 [Novosphingobium sp. KCTC 2891]|uniref:hypothetical protein n=1 Tax=Novosphingobium sp. KCTC 2891 TaxID=2989730 RepID=UPI002222D99F|nr:hypothetical protein [Novosphingobium sp. KCTC 2891]MCW1382618.1 hypothetical protein [Novosphingobium sp. KCTC 2891]